MNMKANRTPNLRKLFLPIELIGGTAPCRPATSLRLLYLGHTLHSLEAGALAVHENLGAQRVRSTLDLLLAVLPDPLVLEELPGLPGQLERDRLGLAGLGGEAFALGDDEALTLLALAVIALLRGTLEGEADLRAGIVAGSALDLRLQDLALDDDLAGDPRLADHVVRDRGAVRRSAGLTGWAVVVDAVRRRGAVGSGRAGVGVLGVV